MSPVIRISDQLYEGLKKHATPFEDTPASVIEKILKHYEETSDEETCEMQPSRSSTNEEVIINPNQPYDLTMTKILTAKVGEYQVKNWNELVRMSHIVAFKSLGSIDDLIQKSHSHIVKRDTDERGFTYVPELGCSIQGVDANNAWKHALHLSKISKTEIAVVLMWRDDERAAFPGEVGVIKWNPTK